MYNIGFWGCGNLARIIAERLFDQTVSGYHILGAYDKNPDSSSSFSGLFGCNTCNSLDELISLTPDFIIEAAAPDALKANAEKVISRHISLIVLSTGAFSDEKWSSELKITAEANHAKIYLASGAIGGFDIMGAARLMGNLKAQIINIKKPEALNGAPYLNGRVLDPNKEELLFSGTAREAIRFFPQNLNVAVSAAIATCGVDLTQVQLKSVPDTAFNTHIIELDGNFGQASLTISSFPSKGNAKSSEIAAWSVLYLLQKLNQSIVFC